MIALDPRSCAAAIRDFLDALARGHLIAAGLTIDGEESAYVTALRDALDRERRASEARSAEGGAMGRAA